MKFKKKIECNGKIWHLLREMKCCCKHTHLWGLFWMSDNGIIVMLNHHFITQYKILKLIVTLLLLLLLQISHLCTYINAGGSLLSSTVKGRLSLLPYSIPYMKQIIWQICWKLISFGGVFLSPSLALSNGNVYLQFFDGWKDSETLNVTFKCI